MQQATWFIDPVGGNDANNGLTQPTAIKTYRELMTRWGTASPTLAQNTTITWVTSQPDDSDPVYFTPIIENGAFVEMTGLPTIVHSGTLSGVVAKNRATGQLLNANIGTPVAPYVDAGTGVWGTLLHNTTRNSWCWLWNAVAANVAELTQPLAPYASFTRLGLLVEHDDTANGDAYDLVQYPQTNIVMLAPTIAFYDGSFNNWLQISKLRINDSFGTANNNVYVGPHVGLGETCLNKEIFGDPFARNVDIRPPYANVISPGGGFFPARAQVGGGAYGNDFYSFFEFYQNNVFDYDVILDALGPTNGLQIDQALYGAVYIRQTGGWAIEVLDWGDMQTASPSGVQEFWGPGTVNVNKGGTMFYSASAASKFVNAGGLQFATRTTGASIDAGGLWHQGITLTPAHLDAAAGVAGFGGLAFDLPTGSTYTTATRE
jgi:hypothetical protein